MSAIQKFSRHMRLNGAGLYIPDTEAEVDFGFGFNWMPEINGNRPFFAYTANNPESYTLSGSEVTFVKNWGTAGTAGDLYVPVNANVNGGPQIDLTAINGEPGFNFQRVSDINGDALTTLDASAILEPPFSVMLFYDLDQNSGGVNIWNSGVTQYLVGHFTNGSHNKSMFNGITRSDTGHPIAVTSARLTFGDGATIDPQYIQGSITELVAGSTGTNRIEGFTLGGAAALYQTPMDGPIGTVLVYPGDEVWSSAEGIALYNALATHYS